MFAYVNNNIKISNNIVKDISRMDQLLLTAKAKSYMCTLSSQDALYSCLLSLSLCWLDERGGKFLDTSPLYYRVKHGQTHTFALNFIHMGNLEFQVLQDWERKSKPRKPCEHANSTHWDLNISFLLWSNIAAHLGNGSLNLTP